MQRNDKKMKLRIWKDNKGVTLIALVITIVILLILAGIAVGSTVGERGTISQSREANEQAEKESIVQKIQADALVEKEKKNRSLTYDEFIEVVEEGNYGTINGDILTTSSGYEINLSELYQGE